MFSIIPIEAAFTLSLLFNLSPLSDWIEAITQHEEPGHEGMDEDLGCC